MALAQADLPAACQAANLALMGHVPADQEERLAVPVAGAGVVVAAVDSGAWEVDSTPR